MTILITMLVLIPMATLMSGMIQQVITDAAWNETQQEAIAVAAAVRSGHLSPVIMPVIPGVTLVQVVGPDRHVISASPAAENKPPMSTAWPTPQNPLQNLQTCANPEPGCLRLTTLRVESRLDSPVVYAARRSSPIMSTDSIDGIVAAQSAILMIFVGWITWRVTGRVLRPVDTIRSELAEITFRNLSHRIAEPQGDDEIAQLIRTLNQSLDRLERAMHDQKRFVADASHELRTPLAGLRVKLEEAQMHPRDIEAEGLLDRTLSDVDRLEAIMADLLLLTGLESNAAFVHERVDLAGLARAELNRRAECVPSIRSHLGDGVTVDGVPSQLSRVLINLLDNAQRHAKHTVDIEVCRDGNEALLTVSDDGAGIAEADRTRIFERFTRLDSARSRDRGGTGLGLAIANEVVQAHSGIVRVGDSPTGGARFEVRLPLHR
ncbi:sensor histidine kinase [Sphaerisporangium perillae]|uniref:sensor histidine kinase n=1 Tax=Sphaerisporangium perillae TaxID=2935860 RepID=UPI00200EF88A|nr:HAMP domain-containing sensor histidine kinase [Sphaerisporangium perillae]